MANNDGWRYYWYTPSLAAAIIFIIAFFATSAFHSWQMARSRLWFMTAIIVGGIFEIIGYAGRVASNMQSPNWTLMPYLIQSLFLLISPPLIAATIYMFLGRIILALDAEHHSLIRKKWLTKIFVAGDIISFMAQGAGGGLMSSHDSDTVKLGQDVVLAGLAFQILLFIYFLVVAVVFYRRVNSSPTRISEDPSIKWRAYMNVLLASSAMILLRNIVRVAEFAESWTGFVMTHEAFIYIFDALLMWLAMVFYNIWHPSKLITAARVMKGSDGSSNERPTAQTLEMT